MKEDTIRSILQHDIEFFFGLLDDQLEEIESSSNIEELDTRITSLRKILKFLQGRMSFILSSGGVEKSDGGIQDFKSVGNS